MVKFGIGAPVGKDSFGFFDLCRKVRSKFAFIDGLVAQNLYRPSRAERLPRQVVRFQDPFAIILTPKEQGDGKNQKGTNYFWIDFSTCIDCGICLQVCPVKGAVIVGERRDLQKVH